MLTGRSEGVREGIAILAEALPGADVRTDLARLLISAIGLCWFPYAHRDPLLDVLGLDPTDPAFVEARIRHVVALLSGRCPARRCRRKGATMTRTGPRSSTLLGARALVGLVGLGYVAAGIALLASPTWFFATIAPFEPYNRHFLGDIGAFTLPVGVALLVAGARPRRHRALLPLGLGASVFHALNHLYDDLLVEASLRHTLSDALPLTAAALALGWAVWTLERSARLHPAERRP